MAGLATSIEWKAFAHNPGPGIPWHGILHNMQVQYLMIHGGEGGKLGQGGYSAL